MSSINYRGPGQAWLKFISVIQSSCGWSGPPASTFILCSSVSSVAFSDPQSSQSPDEVLALNAAAIIANIKLQRQLSKRTSSNVRSETDSSASPQGNPGVAATSFHLYLVTKLWSFEDELKFVQVLMQVNWMASAHWAYLIDTRTWRMLAASERCQIA